MARNLKLCNNLYLACWVKFSAYDILKYFFSYKNFSEARLWDSNQIILHEIEVFLDNCGKK